MKIDLHCHTIEAKAGDAGRNIDACDLADVLAENQVRIAAITNHNLFDLDRYKQCVDAAKAKDIAIWPGIEIDVRGKSGAVGHVIVVADPGRADDFSKVCASLIGDSAPDDAVVEWSGIAPAFAESGFDFLVLSHYRSREGEKMKDKALPYDDNEELRMSFPSGTPFFFEPSNLKRAGIMYADGIHCLIGSDVKDWNDYSKCSLPELKLEVESFRQFLLLLRKTPEALKTVMDRKSAEKVEIRLFDDKASFVVPIYNDVNVVFGARGTGKTEFLKEVEAHYRAKGWTDVSRYYASENNDTYSRMVEAKPEEADFERLGIGDAAECFTFLKEWKDAPVTPFDRYVTWGEYAEKRKDTEEFGFSRASFSEEPDLAAVDAVFEGYRKLNRDVRELFGNRLLRDSLSPGDFSALQDLVGKACFAARETARKSFVEAHALKLESFTIEKMKGYITARTGRPTKPAGTGFAALAMRCKEARTALRSIRDAFGSEPCRDDVLLGRLSEKGDVVQHLTYVVNPSHATGVTYLRSAVKSRALKDFVAAIERASLVASSDLSTEIAAINEKAQDMGISSLRDCLGVSSSVECDGNANYRPSDGEKAMIVLANALFNDNASVYILDEPEASMGNEFVSGVIVDRINQLARENKTVVVSTHNANIAVRTLPWQSIYREYDAGSYLTYTGNPFCDELRDVHGKADSKNWTQTCMGTLEGGEDAFTDRELVYGKLN